MNRPYKYNKLAYQGPIINLDLKKGLYQTFLIAFEQNIYTEKDKSRKCRTYPNEQFASFKDCDFQRIKSKFIDIFPVWLTDSNISRVTNLSIGQIDHYSMDPYFLGDMKSGCHRPCIDTHTNVYFLRSMTNMLDESPFL